jgi:hypothetical protein
MGLGGALLAMHRNNQDIRAQQANHGAANRNRFARRLPRVQSSWVLPSFGDMLNVAEREGDDRWFALFRAQADEHPFGGPAPHQPDYKQAFTHPGKPAPGFTFDFAPHANETPVPPSSSTPIIVVDDSPGSSTTAGGSSGSHNDEPKTILVCARCMDALVTSDSTTGIEYTKRRIWGLRCGHMLDGKCIEEIMKPAPPPPEVSNAVDLKGKGKEILVSEAQRQDKGKGKAADTALSDSNDPLDLFTRPASNSMRSRLRPRPNSTTGSHLLPPSTDISHHAIRPLSTRRPPAAKRNGKGKMKETLVEAEHQWKCPVAGCAKVHTSILVDGQWIMDDKTGAIAIYV